MDMPHVLSGFVAVLFAVGCSIGPPPADVQTVITSIDNASFTITSCTAVRTKTKDPSGNEVTHLVVKASMANTSGKDLTAVQLDFEEL